MKKSAPPARKKFYSVDQYHASFPPGTRKFLNLMRATIRKALPQAEEIISYNIPTFRQGRNIVHYAGYAKHIGYYPGAAPIREFAVQLKKYKTSKGGIQFPLDEPLPATLIVKIARFRLKEMQEK